jgi:hypothetical protein
MDSAVGIAVIAIIDFDRLCLIHLELCIILRCGLFHPLVECDSRWNGLSMSYRFFVSVRRRVDEICVICDNDSVVKDCASSIKFDSVAAITNSSRATPCLPHNGILWPLRK